MNSQISNMIYFIGIIGLCIFFKFKYKKQNEEEEEKEIIIEITNIDKIDKIDKNENNKKVSFDNKDITYSLPQSHTSFFMFFCEECKYGIPNHDILYCYLDKQFCSEFCRNKFMKYKFK